MKRAFHLLCRLPALPLLVSVWCYPFRASADPPPNHECEGAYVITGEGLYSFDNDWPRELNWDVCPIVNDLWYCWTSPWYGPVTIDTCGTTTVDTALAVYSGCECPLDTDSPIVCEGAQAPNYQWPSCGEQSRVTFAATKGEHFLIRLGTSPRETPVGGGTGLFTIRLGPPTPRPCSLPDEQCQPPDTFDAVTSTRQIATSAARFTPVADCSVTDICFWGIYVGEGEDCSIGATDAFEIRYFSDDGGVPGEPLAGPFLQADGSLVVTGPARTDRFTADTAHEYEYSASHPPVTVSAGACYWVEITNAATGTCEWLWSVTTDTRGRTAHDGDGVNPPDGYDETDVISDRLAFRTNIELADTSLCAPPPANDDCAGGLVVGDGVTYFDTLGATTDGGAEQGECDPPEVWCCNFPLGDDYVHRDLWFDYVATCSGVLTVDVDGEDFDTKLAIYDGADCPPSGFAIACNDDIDGIGGSLDSRAAVEVTGGQPYKIRVGGFRESGGWGTMHLECGPRPPNDACDTAPIEELPFLFTGSNMNSTADCPRFPGTHAWLAFNVPEPGSVTLSYGPSATHFTEVSSFLTTSCACDDGIAADRHGLSEGGNPVLTWNCLPAGTYYYPIEARPGSEGPYQIYVSSAPCTNSCEGAAGDCFADHDTPGCEDPACCAAVCAVDEFCCNNSWDAFCAQVASAVCPAFPQTVCAGATGNCYAPNDSPGCDDPVVCERVCGCDPYCCIVDWDELCAGSGFLPEPGCGGAADCNGNGEIDAEEILDPNEPQNADCNGNALPDECDAIGGGDFDADGDVDLTDYTYFLDCFSGAESFPSPSDEICRDACDAAFNFVADGTVPQAISLADFAVLQNSFSAQQP